MDVITMEKSMKDCPENKMKRQWIIVGVICFVAMAFLTVFLMKRYREKTECIFCRIGGRISSFFSLRGFNGDGEIPE